MCLYLLRVLVFPDRFARRYLAAKIGRSSRLEPLVIESPPRGFGARRVRFREDATLGFSVRFYMTRYAALTNCRSCEIIGVQEYTRLSPA
jgi:hypothetical protein